MRSLPLPSLAFFAALKFISGRLCRVLLDAVIAGRNVSHFAGRFDIALNNLLARPVHARRQGTGVVICHRRLREVFACRKTSSKCAGKVAKRRPPIRAQSKEPYRGCVSHRARRASSPRSSAVGGAADAAAALIETELAAPCRSRRSVSSCSPRFRKCCRWPQCMPPAGRAWVEALPDPRGKPASLAAPQSGLTRNASATGWWSLARLLAGLWTTSPPSTSMASLARMWSMRMPELLSRLMRSVGIE